MSKYTLIIKKNETQEILFEQGMNTMIGAVATGNEASAVLLKGSEDELVIAINVVQQEIERVFRED